MPGREARVATQFVRPVEGRTARVRCMGRAPQARRLRPPGAEDAAPAAALHLPAALLRRCAASFPVKRAYEQPPLYAKAADFASVRDGFIPRDTFFFLAMNRLRRCFV